MNDLDRRRRKHLILTITHQCNLSCRYCYEANKSPGTMPLEVAQRVIEKHFANSECFDEIEITLHGGEPFLAFKRLREICEWLWSQSWPKPYVIFVTTNGTVVHGVVQQWAAGHRKAVCLALSLDGTAEMHNANRSNSFDKIDLGFFQRTWPDQPVQMTVSDLTLHTVAEGIIYLHSLGFKINCTLACGIDWSKPETLKQFQIQLEKVTEFYLREPEIEPCDFMLMKMSAIGAESSEGKALLGVTGKRSEKWCGIGTELVAVDCDGTEYPCHLFLPFAVGERLGPHQRFDFATCTSLDDERCNDCVLLPICPTCYASNLLENGSPDVRNLPLCSLTKIRALASSSMQAQMLLRRSEFRLFGQMKPTNLMFTIMGIERVQSSVHL